MARRTGRNMPSRPKDSMAVARSPAAKARGLLGDGFDDDAVLMASPSRRDKSKPATPRQGGKRKRQALDQSPIPLPALQLSEPRTRPRDKEPEPVAAGPLIDAALLQHFRQDDGRFTFLYQLLSFPSSDGSNRILEALAQHAFPSLPSKKLSSVVYDSITTTTAPDVHGLALQVAHIFLQLWKQCQMEKHYAPTGLILDALHFILASEPAETAVHVAERAVPLIIAFVDLVSNPISKASKGGDQALADLFSAAQQTIAAQIDVLDCLELLHLIATSCVSSTDRQAITRLWQAIPSTFAIMLLNKEFPRPQISLMLRILTTSALDHLAGAHHD